MNSNLEKDIKQKNIISFDIELAKKITSGIIDGKITTMSGKNVRICSFDAGFPFIASPIIAIIKEPDGNESVIDYMTDGRCFDFITGRTIKEYGLCIELN